MGAAGTKQTIRDFFSREILHPERDHYL